MEKLRSLSDRECMEIVHDIMALECFDPEVRHMVIFEVLSGDSSVGDKGDRMSPTRYRKMNKPMNF